jgi:protein-tyrosine phosphatase
MPLDSLPLQHALFLLPYLQIAWTGGYLLGTATDNVIAVLLGIQLISFLCLYLAGWMGNHYVKVYCFLSNVIYMVLFVGFLLYGVLFAGQAASQILWQFRIPQLLVLWWATAVGSLLYVLVLPSISEIISGKLYLGNAASALTPALLKEFKITHVLELHDSSRNNDPEEVKAKLLQLECDDILGSQKSLMAIEKHAMEYMDKALKGGGVVLVHCSAGISRSAATTVHWLVSSSNEPSVADAVQKVRRGRPIVDISADHIGAILKFHSDKQA